MTMAEKVHNILVVEDSRFFTTVLRRALESRPGFTMFHTKTLAETEALLADPNRPEFLAALVDLNLPDAPDGEVVKVVVDAKLPVIVFTGAFSDEIREYVLSFNVVDYVSKDAPSSIDTVLYMLNRLARNVGTKVLVVDDSRVSRLHLTRLLENHRFTVLTANSGADALAVVERNPDIRLAIVDHHMEGMDGCQLTRELRRQLPRDILGIIGISAYGNSLTSARFMKYGASDYLNKPFLPEELFCRVYQNVEVLERIDVLSAANKALNAAKQRADDANRFKSAMVAMLSHDLRTPLGAIASYAESLLNGVFGAPANDKHRSYLTHIQDTAQHVVRLSGDLLDMAVIESGRLVPVRERMDVAAVVKDALAMVRPQAEKDGLILSSRLEKLPAVRSDANRVKQILVNLLANAIKFTPEGGTVAVEARAAEFGEIEISVKDSGVGMTAKEIRAAFDAFTQAGDPAAHPAKGWGLGLPIARGLAEALGGSLTATSKPGKGTVMRLTLPQTSPGKPGAA